MTIAATASRLLKKSGDAVTLCYVRGGAVDPATGEGYAGEKIEITGYGYPGAYRSADVDGTTVKSGDIRLTLEKISTPPEKGWAARVDCRSYRVMDVRKVRKSAADVIYICQLRSE